MSFKLKPLGSNKTAVIHVLPSGEELTLYHSYETLVCVEYRGVCFVTEHKYSRTTSKHITSFVDGFRKVLVDDSFFAEAIENTLERPEVAR